MTESGRGRGGRGGNRRGGGGRGGGGAGAGASRGAVENTTEPPVMSIFMTDHELSESRTRNSRPTSNHQSRSNSTNPNTNYNSNSTTHPLAHLSFALPALKSLLPALASDPESLQQIIAHAASLETEMAMGSYLADLVGDQEPGPVEFVAEFVGRVMRARTGSGAGSQQQQNQQLQESRRGDQKGNFSQPRDRIAFTAPSGKGKGTTASSSSSGMLTSDLLDRKPRNKRVGQGSSNDQASQSTTSWGTQENNSNRPSTMATGGPKMGSSSKSASKGGSAVTIKISGGTPMRGGQGTVLTELDAAIKALESASIGTTSISDNNVGGEQPSSDFTSGGSAPTSKYPRHPSRHCGCQARRHDLLKAAPNCLECGHIVCVAEGLGPCSFCGSALLKGEDVAGMIAELKREHGAERMRQNNERQGKTFLNPASSAVSSRGGSGGGSQAQSRSQSQSRTTNNPALAAGGRIDTDGGPIDRVAGTGRTSTYAGPAAANGDSSTALAAATSLRDRLLRYQSENAQRTRIHDEAADFDISAIHMVENSGGGAAGSSAAATSTPMNGMLWASPAERAQNLRKQALVLEKLRDRMRAGLRPGMVINEYDDRDDGKAFGRQKVMTLSLDGKGVKLSMERKVGGGSATTIKESGLDDGPRDDYYGRQGFVIDEMYADQIERENGKKKRNGGEDEGDGDNANGVGEGSGDTNGNGPSDNPLAGIVLRPTFGDDGKVDDQIEETEKRLKWSVVRDYDSDGG